MCTTLRNMFLGRYCCIKKVEKNNIEGEDHSIRQREVPVYVRMGTTFEDLPNELIMMLFDYLYFHEIIYAFYQLNSRTQSLMNSYSSYHLNFDHFITKTSVNLIKSLPLNPQHVKSLTLSNNHFSFTSIQECLLMYPIELFYPRLTSLSFMNCDEHQTLSLILLTPNFQQLKYLSIDFKNESFSFDSIIEQIRNKILFEIKMLKCFKWNSNKLFFARADKTSLNKKSNIENYEFRKISNAEIKWLYLHSENMKAIQINEVEFCHQFDPEIKFETITQLKLDKFKIGRGTRYLF